MPRRPEIGNVQLYPNRPLKRADKNGYVLKFFCPILQKRIRKNCGTRDRREAKQIQRECRERLLNGAYIASGGAITAGHVVQTTIVPASRENSVDRHGRTWQDCYERYRQHLTARIRVTSLEHSLSRINLAERIFEGYRDDRQLSEGLLVTDVMTLDMLEYLQDRLLAGDQCRYDSRSPNTVNSMMGTVMAFVRFCHRHTWIPSVPAIQKLDVDDVMKGRPITGEEFERMLAATPEVVGQESAPSWEFALRVLWESGFRVGDLMDFSWDDDRHIHPVWPSRKGQHPTVVIPATQKNGKVQEIPILPGLCSLLESISKNDRNGWIVNPQPMEYEFKAGSDWFRPIDDDLKSLAARFSNCSIARACGISETTVRNWLEACCVRRNSLFRQRAGAISEDEIAQIRARAGRYSTHPAQRRTARLTKERVSRIVGLIGKKAKIVVRKPDERNGQREKFASAHDLRRGCAQRLINAGVSAETLKVVMRHADFATTEKHYAAMRSAQSAASEVHAKLCASQDPSFVGGLVGGIDRVPQLSPDEVQKLKALLNSL